MSLTVKRQRSMARKLSKVFKEEAQAIKRMTIFNDLTQNNFSGMFDNAATFGA